jgi:hypothetical protein
MQDKILQSMGRGQKAMVTNDGATILKSIYVDNPAAKVLVGVSPILAVPFLLFGLFSPQEPIVYYCALEKMELAVVHDLYCSVLS